MSLFTLVRWQQRFSNLQKAYTVLQRSTAQDTYTELEQAGLVQQFMFCFELSWKTLKDYLANEGIEAETPREIFKQAFSLQMLPDATTWLDALEKRNLLSHTYEEKMALVAVSLIKQNYYPAIQNLVSFLQKKIVSPQYGLDLASWLVILQEFIKYPQIQEILIFGSRAMGNFKSSSDIDLCIKGNLSQDQMFSLQTAFSQGNLPYQVDLLLYHEIQEPALREHIDHFGRSIYP